MKKPVTLLSLFLIASLNFFFITKEPAAVSKKVELYFKQKLSIAIQKLDELQRITPDHNNKKEIHSAFFKARAAYKQTECLLSYYYPSLIRIINGPALPFADGENSLSVVEPHGFQVIEEMLFPHVEKTNPAKLKNEIQSLKKNFAAILYQKDPLGFQDKYILDAISFEVYRMIALGITGYDSPVSFNSIPEAAATVISLGELLDMFQHDLKDSLFKKQLTQHIGATIKYLNTHRDFNQFNRLDFIVRYANPLSEKILQLKKKLNLTLPTERRLLSPLAPHLFAPGYYSPSGYSPNVEANATSEKIMLGEKLFYDTILSVNHKRSCASCHQPEKGFTDGLAKSLALDETSTTVRNAPTLWNAAFQPVQFYDSRATFIEHQVFDVLHNPKEMGGSLDIILENIKQNAEYTDMFKKAYSYTNEYINEENFTNAIASFLRSLVSMNSRFDKYMNGNKAALNQEEKKGFNLFAGKARCATCHFIPLFNGVAPPYFSEAESEVIGVPASDDTTNPELDKDEGKYGLYPISILNHSFKIPTLRNVDLTSPYMHNGVYKTLEDVIDFYDKGGGAGLNIAPANQTLPANRLQLSKEEKKQLIAFLHSLTDTARIELKKR